MQLCVFCQGDPTEPDHWRHCVCGGRQEPPPDPRPCDFCGGDPTEPNHALHCDGQQGRVDADEDHGEEDSAPYEVITSPRETSIEAFYQAIDSGVIATRQAQIWVGLHALGVGHTSNEVFEYLKEVLHFNLRYDSNTRARFTELRDLGLIREVGERACRVTGRTCITWAVVLPSEYAGEAIVERCPTCHQIVARVVPVLVGKA